MKKNEKFKVILISLANAENNPNGSYIVFSRNLANNATCFSIKGDGMMVVEDLMEIIKNCGSMFTTTELLYFSDCVLDAVKKELIKRLESTGYEMDI